MVVLMMLRVSCNSVRAGCGHVRKPEVFTVNRFQHSQVISMLSEFTYHSIVKAFIVMCAQKKVFLCTMNK